MKRVLIIAEAEFLALVRTKFFIIGILVMPVLIGGLFAFLGYAEKQTDRTERHFAVLDGTGALYATLSKAAEQYNRESGEGSAQAGPHFLPENVDSAGRSADDLRIEESARVRRQEIFAFVEIPKSVLDPDAKESVRYYSESTSYTRLSRWLDSTLNAEIEQRRFSTAGVDPSVVKRLTTDVDLDTFGLVERRPDGTTTTAQQVDEIQRFGIPFFFLILMFMSVMSNAQHLINTIIEEKMSKISEVLLGRSRRFSCSWQAGGHRSRLVRAVVRVLGGGILRAVAVWPPGSRSTCRSSVPRLRRVRVADVRIVVSGSQFGVLGPEGRAEHAQPACW